MAEKPTPDQKVTTPEDCCGGHCDTEMKGTNGKDGAQAAEDIVEPMEERLDEVTQTSFQEPDWKTQAAYLAAEIENIQKRVARETSEIRKFANEDILKRITPVLDNLSLALGAASKARSQPEHEALFSNKLFLGFIQGVEMTAKNFEQVLQACGVEFIDSVGKPFDPNLHEALGQTKVEGQANNVIVEEFQRGFKLGGRVVRPAKVIVNRN